MKEKIQLTGWAIVSGYIMGTAHYKNEELYIYEYITRRPMNPTAGSDIETARDVYTLVGDRSVTEHYDKF